MDFNKLANLCYPHVKHTVEEYEKKYPKRKLPEGAEVTRIAPSPTGFLHIGTAYSALIDKNTAGKNGVFYFRLEDTDKKREQQNSGTIAYEMLRLFGVCPSEGYTGDGSPEIGAYGPYVQSERKEIYETFAKYLVERGRAYPCFCEKSEDIAEIKEKRTEQLEKTQTLENRDICRDLTLEEVEGKLKEGKPFALRLRSMGNGEKSFQFTDRMKGEREIRENEKDIILMKSNGIPPYAFAHAVDDHLMHTTTVIRGEEWYPSLSAHLELFDAFGFERVQYAHTPVICKYDEEGNKRKLSKRKDKEADSRYFVEQGYPVGAVISYLLNLANSNFEEWQTKNPTLPYTEFPFSLQKIGSNNPIFDIVKLADISKIYISKYSAEFVFEEASAWAEKYQPNLFKFLQENKEFAIRSFSIDRYTQKPRKDIAKWSDLSSIYAYLFAPFFQNKNLSDFELADIDCYQLSRVLKEYLLILTSYTEKEVWFADIKAMAEKLGFCIDNKLYKANPGAYPGNVADVCAFIRIAVTGRKNSLDLFEIITLLGEDEVRKRLNALLKLID